MAHAATEVIENLIGPTVDAMGYTVVRVRLTGDRALRLQVMVERQDEAAMTVEDCAAVSTAVSAVLDVEDPIAAHYELEVSSPGIDRPLVRLGDFGRFAGFEARIETAAPIEGRKRFRGRLAGVEGETVLIAVGAEEGPAKVPFSAIKDAKLVMTDELIAATLKRRDE